MSPIRKPMWVIFAGPQQFGRPGTRYIVTGGKVTDMRSRAAKFYTLGAAQEFANEKNITLTETRYIGQEDFMDFEIQAKG